MDELTTKRLAVIKQLYLHGVEQSYEVEPMNGFSILSFHDSVEMFMKLCAEQKGVKINKDVNFGDYFVKLPNLSGSATMTNLNNKRVSLKHYGSLPSNLDIEVSRANVTDFLEQNTPIFFNVGFDEISLISLISYDSVKEYLGKSQDFLSKGDYVNSILNSQIGFKELLAIHNEKNSELYVSPFRVTKDFTFLNSFFMGLHFDDNRNRMGDFIDRVGESFKELEDTINIIGFGIDYKKYCKFKMLSPIIEMWNESEKRTYKSSNPFNDRRICDKKNAEFCYNFVIDSALKLQRFNLNIEETIKALT